MSVDRVEPDLFDQLEEGHEGQGGAHQAEQQDGGHDRPGRKAGRALPHRPRARTPRDHGYERDRGQAEAREVTEIPGGHQRPDGVAHRDQPDHADRAQVSRPDVETEQRHDTGQTDQQADQPAPVEADRRGPVRAARMTAISGTVAISSPESELGSRRSASDSSHQGTAISTTQ